MLVLSKNIFGKIIKMPSLPIFYRLYYEIAKKTRWFYLKFLVNQPSKVDLSKIIDIKNNNYLNYFRQRNNPKFLINSLEQKKYQNLWLKSFSGQREELIQLADNICSLQIDIFNLKNFNFGKQINWHLDPLTNKEWLAKHWSLININNQEMGDIKYCWQLNRFQHFYILGRAYWITNDEKYAQEFISQTNDWIKNNHPEMGVNWLSSLELSVRLISWVWAFYFFINSPAFTSEFLKKYLKTIYLMTRHIEKNINLAKYCIRNDHYIGEATALFIIGTTFPEFKESKKWQKKGWQIINQEIIKQVYDDGVFSMLSPIYQRFVMEFYLLAFKLAELNEINIPATSKGKIEKMTWFISSLINKNGKVPSFGENDSSKLFILGNHKFDDFYPILENSAMIIADKSIENKEICEESFWLFGHKYLEKKHNKDFYKLKTNESFLEGGYHILKNKKNKIIFRCGSNKNGYGHADMLHFTLETDGSPILLDNGTYLYNAEKKWRDYFKGTRTHNTVVVDEQDQMINWRKFRWLYLTKAKLINFVENKYIEGEHLGYARFKHPVIHRRAVSLKENRIVINDKFAGSGNHQLDFYFHLPKSNYQINEKTKEFSAKIHDKNIKIFPQEIKDIKISVLSGSENPISGWHSPAYGSKNPCLTLKYSLKTSIPYQSTIILSL